MSDQRCDPDVWHANGLPATDCATCFPPGSRNPYAAPGIGIPPPEPWPEDDAPGHTLMAAETQTPCPECGYHPDMVRNALRAGTRCKTCGRFWEGSKVDGPSVRRNRDTAENSAFWDAIDASARAVENWPEWMKKYVVSTPIAAPESAGSIPCSEPDCIDITLRRLRAHPATTWREEISGLATDDLVIDRDQARHFADEVDGLRERLAATSAAFAKKVCDCGTPRATCNFGLRHEAWKRDGEMVCATCPEETPVVEVDGRFYCVREILDDLAHQQFENDCLTLKNEQQKQRIATATEERDAARATSKRFHRRAQEAEGKLAKAARTPIDTWSSAERQKEAAERDAGMAAVAKAAARSVR